MKFYKRIVQLGLLGCTIGLLVTLIFAFTNEMVYISDHVYVYEHSIIIIIAEIITILWLLVSSLVMIIQDMRKILKEKRNA